MTARKIPPFGRNDNAELESLDDEALARLVKERANQPTMPVSMEDLSWPDDAGEGEGCKAREMRGEYRVDADPVGWGRPEAVTHHLVVPLGEVCRTTSGGTPSRKNADFFNGPIPWVKSGELPDGPIVEIEESISEEAVRQSSAKLFPTGTLLIALYGATVGKLGILTNPAATNQAVCAIFPPPDIDTKFLFWFLRFKRSDLISQAVGGAQPNISQGIVRELKIPLLSLDQQKRIVAEIEKQFSRLDEAVANLKRVKANLKRYKAAVLKAAVEGRLVETEAELARREGRDYETGAQLLQRIAETRRSQRKGKGKYKEPTAPDTTDLPELPEGWVWCSGGQFFEWSSGEGLTEKNQRSGPYAVYGGNGISGHHDEYFVDEPTLVVGRVGAHCGNVYVTKPKCWITDNAIYAKSFPRGVPLVYLQIVFEQAGLNRIAAGSGQPFVNQRMLNEVSVPFPPLNEQLRILAEVERRLSILRETETQLDANLQRAARLRQSILGKAFSGALSEVNLNAVTLSGHSNGARVR